MRWTPDPWQQDQQRANSRRNGDQKETTLARALKRRSGQTQDQHVAKEHKEQSGAINELWSTKREEELVSTLLPHSLDRMERLDIPPTALSPIIRLERPGL